METLGTDYLIVGSGAMGLAFADVLLHETNADVVIVDRHARPGGHWNDAYPFVRLHTPSAFYGVASRPLGEDRVLATGANAGLYEVASAQEICAYFDEVMQHAMLPTGRVRYFPMTDYRGDLRGEHAAVSLLTGEKRRIVVRKKVVDATYTDTQVATTHPPTFPIAKEVAVMPVHDLVRTTMPYSRYVILGAGKSAVDTCLWLLEKGVSPGAIRWIKPREAWFHDRAHMQPGSLALSMSTSNADILEAAARAQSVEDLFDRLRAAKVLLRVDESVPATMYRCTTVSAPELDALRRIEDVVRLGRVTRIDRDRVTLERGTLPVEKGDLFVYCGANGVRRRPALPVFDGARITLQNVRWCLPLVSAALAAHLEATRDDDDDAKNRLSTPIPYPETDRDWIRVFLANFRHDLALRSDPEVRAWMNACRLNPGSAVAANAKADDPAWQRVGARVKEHAPAAYENFARLDSELAGAR